MAKHGRSFYESAQAMLAGVAEDRPVVMINLLRYRERAAYPPGSDALPCTGQEAYGRYGQAAIGFITALEDSRLIATVPTE
jgi:hypothetical protein